MTAGSMAANEAAKMSKMAVQEGVNLARKTWSLLDAAAKKTPPSDYLSPEAIRSIQGKR